MIAAANLNSEERADLDHHVSSWTALPEHRFRERGRYVQVTSSQLTRSERLDAFDAYLSSGWDICHAKGYRLRLVP